MANYSMETEPGPGWVRPKALDIGCGSGAGIRLLEDCGFDVTAFDVSPTAVGRVQSKSAYVFAAGIEDVAFEPASFDFVMDNLTLTHVGSPDFDKIRGWLKPNGWFVSAMFEHGPRDAPEARNHFSGMTPRETIVRMWGSNSCIVKVYRIP